MTTEVSGAVNNHYVYDKVEISEAFREVYDGPTFEIPKRFALEFESTAEPGGAALAEEIIATRNDHQLQCWLGQPVHDALLDFGLKPGSATKTVSALEPRGVFSVRDLVIAGDSGDWWRNPKPAAYRLLLSRLDGVLPLHGKPTFEDLLRVCPSPDDIPGLVLGDAGVLPSYRSKPFQLTVGLIAGMDPIDLRDTIDPHRTSFSTDFFRDGCAAAAALVELFDKRLSQYSALVDNKATS